MVDYDKVTDFDNTKRCTGTWASGLKEKDEILIGFSLDDDDMSVKLTSEQAVDVFHHIFYVMGWRRFFKQLLHNKFKR